MTNFQRQDHCDCIDYPVSWGFYRQHCREVHGWDPGDNEPQGFQPHIIREPPDLTPMRVAFTDLQNKLNNHIDSTKKKAPKPSRGVYAQRDSPGSDRAD